MDQAHEAQDPFPPMAPGMVTRRQACEWFGVAMRTWSEWERSGRVRGELVAAPGTRRRCRLYRREELARLKEEIDRRHEPYPDPDPRNAGCYRVPVASRVKSVEAIIDAASLPLVEGKRWNWSVGSGGRGCVVLATRGSPKPPLHQIVMGVRGARHRVGHLNGDPLDCRRANLVVRTASEQARAARKMRARAGRACGSRYKGVSWSASNQRWNAAIHAEGERLHLGLFRTELAAALAYDAAARERFGEHARLNFPPGSEPDAETVREAMEAEAYEPPFPPPGTVERREARGMFGVSERAWVEWERKGRIACGRWAPLPGNKPGRCKVYPVEELKRLVAEFEQVGKPYADPDPRNAGCWRVPLRSLLHKMEAIIDAESLPVVEGRHWNWAPPSEGYGGRVVLSTVEGPMTPLARLIAGVKGARWRVSHANGDPLDCRRANLVVRTIEEQVRGNRKMGSVSGREYTSRYKGVSWNEERGKWLAQIRCEEVHRHLGRFDSEEDAALAYDAAARELFGEHARLNFPEVEGPGAAELLARRGRAA